MSTNGWILVVFVVYFTAIIGMALFFRKSQNLSDYFLAGRKLNTFVGALSPQTSDMSGWMLMGLPGAIYLMGMGYAWIAIGLTAGIILKWLFVAKRLRRYSIVANNAITLPQYLENRFYDKSHALKIIAAIFFGVFFAVYAAASFVAGGRLLTSLFNINYMTAVLIVAAIVVAYTFIGGLKAISWTDTIQGMMMLLAVFFLPLIAINIMGGFESFSNFAALSVEDGGVLPAGFFNLMLDRNGDPLTAVSIISNLAWGLGYFGMPHILIKLMAIKSERTMNRSAGIAIGWVVIALSSAVLVGLVGRAFVPQLYHMHPWPQYGAHETVFIEMVRDIFMPAGAAIPSILLGGLFLCGIFAAIKSTADSQLLVSSSAITNDIYKGVNKKASDKHLVWFSRFAILIIAAIAIWIASDENSGVMALVRHAWAGFGAAFGPLVLLSLYWKRTNKAGAIAGIIVGGLTVIVWSYIPFAGYTLAQSTALYSLVPGFFLAAAAIIIVSLITKKPSAEVLADFEKASVPLVED